MKHRQSLRKLGRSPSHRRATLRNLATSLILHKRIETTLPKAKELRRVADKLVTLGKKNTLHARRTAMSYLFAMNREVAGDKQKLTPVHKLFTEIAPGFSSRNGGYTRVLRTRIRKGDNAQMALIEFVSGDVQPRKETRKKRAVKRATETAPVVAASKATSSDSSEAAKSE